MSTTTTILRSLLSNLLLLSLLITESQAQQPEKPNVLFIAIDDLNDWIGALGGYAGEVHTPNIDRLAEKGMLFTRAYCSSPMCNPSRVALWTGKRPSTTGVYGQYSQWDDNRTKNKTLFQTFKDQGYQLYGGGKIFHHGTEVRDDPAFDAILPFTQSGHAKHAKKAGAMRYGRHHLTEEEMPDYKLVTWTIDQMNHTQEPFMLVPGIFLPHSPLWVPAKFFDLYPLESIQVPETPADEFDDIPEWGKRLANRKVKYDPVVASGKTAEVIQAYLAAISFTDNQVGRLIDALEASPYAQNTIVVLWSDHGFHLGEKFHFAKSTLWEESARIPCIIYAPGLTDGTNCDRPMDTIDLYPTLTDLCGLNAPDNLDGISMRPLLQNPEMPWKPAISILQHQNVTVRSDDFRYIRYADGSEELYDHRKDASEHQNLAANPEYAGRIQELGQHIPADFAPNALPYPFHKGYIPPQIWEEYKATQSERQADWVAPSRYTPKQ